MARAIWREFMASIGWLIGFVVAFYVLKVVLTMLSGVLIVPLAFAIALVIFWKVL